MTDYGVCAATSETLGARQGPSTASLVLINARAPRGEKSVVFAPPAAKVYAALSHSLNVVLADDRLKKGAAA